MKNSLLIALFVALTIHLPAQKIVLAGVVENSDTLTITVWSKSKLILETITTEPIYAIILGNERVYHIQFECQGQEKDATLITKGMDKETINLPVDFANLTDVMMYKDKHRRIKKRKKIKQTNEITFIYYGFHAYRNKF